MTAPLYDVRDLDGGIAPAAAAPADDDTVHLVCCNDDLALCGADVTDTEWRPPGTVCRRCRLLAFAPTCGARCCRLRALCRAVYDRIRAGAR